MFVAASREDYHLALNTDTKEWNCHWLMSPTEQLCVLPSCPLHSYYCSQVVISNHSCSTLGPCIAKDRRTIVMEHVKTKCS